MENNGFGFKSLHCPLISLTLPWHLPLFPKEVLNCFWPELFLTDVSPNCLSHSALTDCSRQYRVPLLPKASHSSFLEPPEVKLILVVDSSFSKESPGVHTVTGVWLDLVSLSWVRISPALVELTVLGETPGDTLWLVLKQGLRKAALGRRECHGWGETSCCLLCSWELVEILSPCDLRSTSAMGKRLCRKLGTRVHSKMSLPWPLPSRKFASRVWDWQQQITTQTKWNEG